MCLFHAFGGLLHLLLRALKPASSPSCDDVPLNSVSQPAQPGLKVHTPIGTAESETQGGNEAPPLAHSQHETLEGVAEAETISSDPKVDFPNELWLECFAYLHYLDLKRLSMVCKRFHELEKTPSLDYYAFRDGSFTPSVEPSGKRFSMHPVLAPFLEQPTSVSAESAILTNGKEGEEERQWNLYELSCVNEYATRPPTTTSYLRLRHFGGVVVPIEAEGAVTVLEMVVGLAKFKDAHKDRLAGRLSQVNLRSQRGLVYPSLPLRDETGSIIPSQ